MAVEELALLVAPVPSGMAGAPPSWSKFQPARTRIAAGHDDIGHVVSQACYVDTAALLGEAMTDYLLAAGTKTAPAWRAPDHMAAWLCARGYRIVRAPRAEPADPEPRDPFVQITALTDVRRVA